MNARHRGFVGTMEAPTRLDDESYLDFVEGMRGFTLKTLQSRATDAAKRRLEACEDVSTLQDPAAVDKLVRQVPDVAFRHRWLRTAQEMIWEATNRTYHADEDRLLDELATAEHEGPGSLTIPEDFEHPEYLVDYHLEPGGYHTDPLSGFIYHYGTKIFWLGANDEDQQKRRYVSELAIPVDGQVEAVLDLACSVGQSTTAFKERFPDATVHGIDVAAPLLRYAHWRATRLDSEVHFTQMAAENLEFENDSFDVVYGAILFHEVPLEVGERIVAEAARVVRPGGVFLVGDLRPTNIEDPWDHYLTWWDTRFNGEPHEYAFRRSDFTSLLEKHFADVTVDVQSPATALWTCRLEGEGA